MKDRMDVAEKIRSYYRAYETSDRAVVEQLLSNEFTFTSPLDDRIDRATYFSKCWPGNDHLQSFTLHQLVVDGQHALIRYEAEWDDGTSFENVEHFELGRDQVTHIDVYFGSLPNDDKGPF
jgi:ketosteroid isomerase-like protein